MLRGLEPRKFDTFLAAQKVTKVSSSLQPETRETAGVLLALVRIRKDESLSRLGQGISDQLTGKTGQKIFNKLTNQATFDR